MLYHDSHFDENDCTVQEDGCVVNWGRRNLCCPYLAGVYYKSTFYAVESEEFQEALGGDIDYSLLFWDCRFK